MLRRTTTRANLHLPRKAVQPYANTAQVKDFDAKFGYLLHPTSA
ncbi:MAG: hypothetical protein ACRDSL_18720 [Pseudonocardiaceae bacterium]